jgi:hypothetical protein
MNWNAFGRKSRVIKCSGICLEGQLKSTEESGFILRCESLPFRIGSNKASYVIAEFYQRQKIVFFASTDNLLFTTPTACINE